MDLRPNILYVLIDDLGWRDLGCYGSSFYETPRQHCDGVSLQPLWSGEGRLEREAIYFHYPHYSNQGGTPSAAVVQGDWKLIRFFEDEHQELYQLREDVSEAVNLSAIHPGRVRAMGRLLDGWIADVGAGLPQPNPGFVPEAG